MLALIESMTDMDICIYHIPFLGAPKNKIIEQINNIGRTLASNWPPRLGSDDHVFIYLNDYAPYFGSDQTIWRMILKDACTAQFAVNLSIGRLFSYSWLGKKTTQIFFQNREMAGYWNHKIKQSEFKNCPSTVLPPPVDTSPFLDIKPRCKPPLIISRLGMHLPMGQGAILMYKNLSKLIPDAEFWFMDTPLEISENFASNPRFRLLDSDEITVHEFFTYTDIYCVSVAPNWPALQGPRSLVEAMAAGKPSVSNNRTGPADRIATGIDGFLANNLIEMENYVIELANNTDLRIKIGRAAREKARNWSPRNWVRAIVKGMERN